MNEFNSLKIDKENLIKQTKIRLDIISEIENYFHQEINRSKVCSKKLSKYVAPFDYIDKVLIVSVVARGGVSIISFSSVVGAPRNSKWKFYSNFLSNNKNNQNITKHNKKQKENYDKILMLAKS